MPAYRSSAEAEIRVAVVERLREIVPGCRIIHEINAESFGNRIDVLAVGIHHIAAVEIKSAKDKLDRLPAQIKAMRSVTNSVFAALHEKFLTPVGIDGQYGVSPPDESRGAIVWAYPRMARKGHVECQAEWLERDRWAKSKRSLLPDALRLLWRAELQEIASCLGVKGIARMTVEEAADHIRWHMTGQQIAHAICATLRRRDCIEADPVMAVAA